MNSQTLTAAYVRRLIPHRPKESQKGRNGHILLVAGSRDMPGAAILSALGALKAGAGLLTVAIPEAVRKILIGRVPEAMTIPTDGIKSYVRRRTLTTLAAGPGLTVHPSVRKTIRCLLSLGLPLVLDADGLNAISKKDLNGKSVVITPHPGELARLLGKTVRQIQKNRVATATHTARSLGILCVLKGHKTIISDGHRTFVNSTGNQAMATGGMGDVLTGIIAGFQAQGLSLFDAACAGVYIHGLAGDLARISDRGLRASELADRVPDALKKIGIR